MNAQRAVRVVVLSCFLLLPGIAFAQAESGNIVGVVRDISGAVIPGVAVEAASPALIERVPHRRERRAGPLQNHRSAARRLHCDLHLARL